jgi:hypothetical protein
MKTHQGARFEILVDGKPRSYHDRKDIAIESAEFIKSRNPLNEVAVKDLDSGELTVVAYKPGPI